MLPTLVTLLAVVDVLLAQTVARPTSNVNAACLGTTHGMTMSGGSAELRYTFYRNNYEGCHYVIGNLEINIPGNNHTDFSFLHNIREVTGYVMIHVANITVVPLPQLKIIRGEELLKYPFDGTEKSFSFLLIFNSYLVHLNMTSLREISNGDVLFQMNRPLSCHASSKINWRDIFAHESQNVYSTPVTAQPCIDCDSSCESAPGNDSRLCWSPSPLSCQRLNKVVCASQCDHRCFGRLPRDCCHPECLGGCSGPTAADCWGCRNFFNDGVCEPHCPPMQYYDKALFAYVDNPNKKYSFGNLCVKTCPGHYAVHNGGCVRMCPEGYQKDNRSICVPCTGSCPKTCRVSFTDENYITSKNIDILKNCTHVNGNLVIPEISFLNDSWDSTIVKALTPENMTILSTIKEVTGFVSIQAINISWMTNFSFLRNLEEIGGTQLWAQRYALDLQGEHVQFFGLTALKKIGSGHLYIDTPRQCYTSYAVMKSLVKEQASNATVYGKIRNTPACVANNMTCDSQCASALCWGPGSHMCLRCANSQMPDGQCVANCSSLAGYYTALTIDSNEQQMCRQCHEECADTCTGPLPSDCASCKHARDGSNCTSDCPDGTYVDYSNGVSGVCTSCHPDCKGGCTGPSNHVGLGSCRSCHKVVMKSSYSTHYCISLSMPCPHGHFNTTSPHEEHGGILQCVPCHEQCDTCIFYGSEYCETCKKFKVIDKPRFHCASVCPVNFYEYVETSRVEKMNGGQLELTEQHQPACAPCHDSCRKGCRGPHITDCIKCSDKRLQVNATQLFTCVTDCPPEFAFVTKDKEDQLWCVAAVLAEQATQKEEQQAAVIGGSVGAAIFLIAVLLVGLISLRRAKSREKSLHYEAKIVGAVSTESLSPTDARPDLAQLILIKESDMSRGVIIGSGAFGTVFKGFWKPEGESFKIPVAIKVLQEGTTSEQNASLLEEARVMASVQHPCCVRIIAVCLSAQTALLSQLMPLGCLLEYVRKHRANLGSKALLNWCAQIAQGMEYLEGRGIVHRDLAARNVLVHSRYQVKITDFGLAKVLDPNEERYLASSGKMPIKWMALESIQYKVFTHKTDVWSYGVTLWELFTYGQKPYDSLPARSIPSLLEKGERLPQPAICTIDVFMVMVKCWMLDSDSRPTFSDLAQDFARMSRDPGRYLVIEGDQLRKLPSVQYDARHLLDEDEDSQMDADEVSGDFVDADEYLKPTSVTATTSESSMTALEQAIRRLPAENNKEPDEDDTVSPPQSPDSRYAPTPIRLRSTNEFDDCESQLFLHRVDETGYLQPQSAMSDYLQPVTHTRPPYLDIIPEHNVSFRGNSSQHDLHGFSVTSKNPQYINVGVPHTKSTASANVDNPNYFLTPSSCSQDDVAEKSALATQKKYQNVSYKESPLFGQMEDLNVTSNGTGRKRALGPQGEYLNVLCPCSVLEGKDCEDEATV